MIRSFLVCLLVVALLSCASTPVTNAPVTVWYDRTYAVKPDGSKVQKVETIPWTKDLTFMRAVTSAGGYTTPPVRHVYLVRDEESIELDVRAIERKQTPDPVMEPGDRIELRSTQNNGFHGAR